MSDDEDSRSYGFDPNQFQLIQTSNYSSDNCDKIPQGHTCEDIAYVSYHLPTLQWTKNLDQLEKHENYKGSIYRYFSSILGDYTIPWYSPLSLISPHERRNSNDSLPIYDGKEEKGWLNEFIWDLEYTPSFVGFGLEGLGYIGHKSVDEERIGALSAPPVNNEETLVVIPVANCTQEKAIEYIENEDGKEGLVWFEGDKRSRETEQKVPISDKFHKLGKYGRVW